MLFHNTNSNKKSEFISKYYTLTKYSHSNETVKNSNSNYNSSYGLKDFVFFKKPVTSGASRSTFKVRTYLPIKFKINKFTFSKKNKSGRSNKFGILCRSKGTISTKMKYPNISKSYRLLSLSFIANIFLVPFSHKLYSLVFSSTGTMTYVYTSQNHLLFKVTRLQSVLKSSYTLSRGYFFLSKFIKIPQFFFLIFQLPKYKFISLLEIFPSKGIKYVRSAASKAFINKVDTKLNLTLIKLPSGVHKVFSNFSVGSVGIQPFSSKKTLNPLNAGFYKKSGKKSLSRGIAKNPIDHPHGGRSKAIRYQRTP